MWRAIIYSMQEGLLALWRTKLVSLLSIGTMAISFAVLGVFLLVGVNVGAMAESYGHELLVHVFLRDDIEAVHRSNLRQRLEGDDCVLSVRLVSKEEAKQRFEELFPYEKDLLSGLQQNPLPTSFEIVLSEDMRDVPERVTSFVESLRTTEGVEEVSYDRQWVETLEAAARSVTYFGLVLGGLLILAAIVTAANIIKINVYARREEIEIMRLVGAEGAYVKGPFIFSGLIQGLLASVLAVLVLFILFQVGVGYIRIMRIEMLEGLEYRFLPWQYIALFVAGGLFVGLLASLLSFGRAGRA